MRLLFNGIWLTTRVFINHQTDHNCHTCLSLCSCRESWTPGGVRVWSSKTAAGVTEVCFPLRITPPGHHVPHALPVRPLLSPPLPCALTLTLRPCCGSREPHPGWKAQRRACSWTRCPWTLSVGLKCHHPPGWRARRGSPAWRRQDFISVTLKDIEAVCAVVLLK